MTRARRFRSREDPSSRGFAARSLLDVLVERRYAMRIEAAERANVPA
jgi:hypothetical protein